MVDGIGGLLPLSLNSDLLGQYFALRASSTVAVPAAAAAKSDPASLPPWDAGRPQPSASAALKDALTAPTFLKATGHYFDRADIPADHKKLFSLYIALSRLVEIASHAASESTPLGLLSSLDKRLQQGLGEITQFLSEAKFDDLTLLRGNKSAFAQTPGTIAPRTSSTYVGTVAQRGAFEAPLAALTGNEVFTISVKKLGGTTNITIDLSQMGAPPTLGNIISFINDALAAAGMFTRFKAEKLGEEQYAIKIAGVSTEALTLSAPVATPSVYLTGVSGSGAAARGQVLRLDEVVGGSPTLSISRAIESPTGPVSAKASALDSQGNLYVLGTTEGDFGNGSLKGTRDVYLTKYDSRGQVAWTHLLGAAESAEGMALAIDGNDNVVVAGSVEGKLSSVAIGGGTDSFVTKLNSQGVEIFTRQIAPLKDDAATALVIGDDGAIYVGGWTKGALSGQSAGGGADGYVTKLDSAGKLVYNRQFGGTDDERTQAIALTADGKLLVASLEDGRAILRKYDTASGAGAAIWEKDLGAIAGGAIGAIAVSGSDIYVAGSTGNAALDAGGEATIAAAANGGIDGFLMRLSDSGATPTALTVTYLGTAGTDSIKSLVISGGALYVVGSTNGTLPGQTKSGPAHATNGFAAKLQTNGTVDWLFQYGGVGGVSSAHAISVDPVGTSVLDALGLPRGRIDYTRSPLVTANTSLRAGDSFVIAVNGKPAQTIRISASDTRHSLTAKINAVLVGAGKATTLTVGDGYALKISANAGMRIELRPGPVGSDALKGLGLVPDVLVGRAISSDGGGDMPDASANVVGLELDRLLSVLSRESAKKAESELRNALLQVKAAYRKLTLDPLLEKLKSSRPKPAGPAPAFLLSQLANYQAGLSRLSARFSPSILL